VLFVKASLLLLLITVMAVFLLAVPRPVAASCGGNTAVGDETALNNAIMNRVSTGWLVLSLPNRIVLPGILPGRDLRNYPIG